MKTRLLLITALLLAMDAGAQTTPDESARKAKETLDKVSAANQKLKTFEARFSFTLNNQQEHITEKYDGNILVSGEKYRLTLTPISTAPRKPSGSRRPTRSTCRHPTRTTKRASTRPKYSTSTATASSSNIWATGPKRVFPCARSTSTPKTAASPTRASA